MPQESCRELYELGARRVHWALGPFHELDHTPDLTADLLRGRLHHGLPGHRGKNSHRDYAEHSATLRSQLTPARAVSVHRVSQQGKHRAR